MTLVFLVGVSANADEQEETVNDFIDFSGKKLEDFIVLEHRKKVTRLADIHFLRTRVEFFIGRLIIL